MRDLRIAAEPTAPTERVGTAAAARAAVRRSRCPGAALAADQQAIGRAGHHRVGPGDLAAETRIGRDDRPVGSVAAARAVDVERHLGDTRRNRPVIGSRCPEGDRGRVRARGNGECREDAAEKRGRERAARVGARAGARWIGLNVCAWRPRPRGEMYQRTLQECRTQAPDTRKSLRNSVEMFEFDACVRVRSRRHRGGAGGSVYGRRAKIRRSVTGGLHLGPVCFSLLPPPFRGDPAEKFAISAPAYPGLPLGFEPVHDLASCTHSCSSQCRNP